MILIRDATSIEPERPIFSGGPGDFLGELNLLTGQSVYLTARVVSAGELVRIDLPTLRRVLAEQADIADVLIQAFQERREIIRSAAGSALELVGRPETRQTQELRQYVTQMLLPPSWHDAHGRAERWAPAAPGLSNTVLLHRRRPGVGLAGRGGHRPEWLRRHGQSAAPRIVGAPLPFQTSTPRVFAVGDLRSGSTKRVATAVGEGASAVSSVHAALANG